MDDNLEMDKFNEKMTEGIESDDCEEKESLPRNIGNYINGHVRRTIGFPLEAPNITH